MTAQARVEAAAAAEDCEVVTVEAAEATAGDLATALSPSLFGGRRVVQVLAAESLSDAAAGALLAYTAQPEPDVALVAVFPGGNSGKRLLAALEKVPAALRVDCPKVTKFSERLEFVRGEFHAAGRRVGDDAARALIDAVGADLTELATACAQLVADTSGAITPEVVARYHRGRAEATGWAVADHAIEGHPELALEQLRWALQSGTPPVVLGGALAQALRSLAQVAAVRGGRAADNARELGMPPWKIDRVRRQLQGWNAEALAAAVQAVARADAEIKGAATDPEFAVERAVLDIVAARRTEPVRR